jgi:hypothetical protein
MNILYIYQYTPKYTNAQQFNFFNVEQMLSNFHFYNCNILSFNHLILNVELNTGIPPRVRVSVMLIYKSLFSLRFLLRVLCGYIFLTAKSAKNFAMIAKS